MMKAGRRFSSFLNMVRPLLLRRVAAPPFKYALSRGHEPFENPVEFHPLLVALSRSFSSPSKPTSPPLPPLALLRGGCYDETSHDLPLLPLCPGCGVHMQDSDPDLPGFFSNPSLKSSDYHASVRRISVAVDEPQISYSLKSGRLYDEADKERQDSFENSRDSTPVVCARCHSLRHYGRVKNAAAENLLPDFDFDRMVGPKLVSAAGSRSIILMVVDAVDFDGSFPRKVAKLISASIEENASAWKEGKPGNVPRVLLVVTKIDLLPASLSPTGLEYWVRQRAHAGGANKITGVHLVSSFKDWGIKNLVDHVRQLVGSRGNVWAVGAQNAGNHLTEAPVPGTTLGIVRVEGILSGQISMRLMAEEQKLLHISKELRPRTYRIKAGHSVHIAGLMRLDVEEISVDTIYVTVWASPLLPLHMGKMDSACSMLEKHFGRQLQPPIGEDRVGHLGKWARREFRVSGNSWDVSSVDIAAAGLGWFAIGLKGEAVLGAWTYEGVDVVLRSSLIPARAKIFEVTGFTVSKIVSEADSAADKLKRKRKGKKLADISVNSNAESLMTTNAGDRS
ncbi:unnamed protein product [Spirodela intermedia]|uniref:NOA1/YqeH-like C-terminal domain-containing protein n=1 Tax=Spirodela intermedia TaxID=51605 RepID=A0A7I8J8Q9_SPIIN|nr:unnamed protein product [Spirodela intermedia]CAA6666155.1 unnamed protein product [Spirodela intermedia]